MKINKGFALIELIIVIVFLGILGLIIFAEINADKPTEEENVIEYQGSN